MTLYDWMIATQTNQAALARRLGCSWQAVGRWLDGSTPGPLLRARIAAVVRPSAIDWTQPSNAPPVYRKGDPAPPTRGGDSRSATLRTWMEIVGLSQFTLASRLAVNPDVVASWINGGKAPALAIRSEIAAMAHPYEISWPSASGRQPRRRSQGNDRLDPHAPLPESVQIRTFKDRQ